MSSVTLTEPTSTVAITHNSMYTSKVAIPASEGLAYHVAWRVGIEANTLPPMLEISTSVPVGGEREGVSIAAQRALILVSSTVAHDDNGLECSPTGSDRYMEALLTPDGDIFVSAFLKTHGSDEPVYVALDPADFVSEGTYHAQNEYSVHPRASERSLKEVESAAAALRKTYIGDDHKRERKSFEEDPRCSRMRVEIDQSSDDTGTTGSTFVVFWSDGGGVVALPVPMVGPTRCLEPMWSHLNGDWVSRRGDPGLRPMRIPVSICTLLNRFLETVTETDRCVRWASGPMREEASKQAASIRSNAMAGIHRLMTGYVHSNGKGGLCMMCCCPPDLDPDTSHVSDPWTTVRQIYTPTSTEGTYVKMSLNVMVRPHETWTYSRAGQFLLPTTVCWFPSALHKLLVRDPWTLTKDRLAILSQSPEQQRYTISSVAVRGNRTDPNGDKGRLVEELTGPAPMHPTCVLRSRLTETGSLSGSVWHVKANEPVTFSSGAGGGVVGVGVSGRVYMQVSPDIAKRGVDVKLMEDTLRICFDFVSNCTGGARYATDRIGEFAPIQTIGWATKQLDSAEKFVEGMQRESVEVDRESVVQQQTHARAVLRQTRVAVEYTLKSLLDGAHPVIRELHGRMFMFLGVVRAAWLLASGSDGGVTSNRSVLLLRHKVIGFDDMTVVFVRRDNLLDPEYLSRADPTEARALAEASSVCRAIRPSDPTSVRLITASPMPVHQGSQTGYRYFTVEWHDAHATDSVIHTVLRVRPTHHLRTDSGNPAPQGRYITTTNLGKERTTFNKLWGIEVVY